MMTTKIPDNRRIITDLLWLFSSEQEQWVYETKVSIADAPVEFVCMWFDDQYHPDDAFFCPCFTADELATLAEFHRFYDKHERQLPDVCGTVRTWLASPVSCGILSEAQSALDRLELSPG